MFPQPFNKIGWHFAQHHFTALIKYPSIISKNLSISIWNTPNSLPLTTVRRFTTLSVNKCSLAPFWMIIPHFETDISCARYQSQGKYQLSFKLPTNVVYISMWLPHGKLLIKEIKKAKWNFHSFLEDEADVWQLWHDLHAITSYMTKSRGSSNDSKASHQVELNVFFACFNRDNTDVSSQVPIDLNGITITIT